MERWRGWVRRMARGAGGVVAAAVATALAAGAAGAQEALKGVRSDSLGVAADAVPVPFEHIYAGECGITGHAVVADSADLARLRVWPQCRDAPIPPLRGRTLVGLSLMGDCHAMVRFDAFRSESRRELRVRVLGRYGGCRAGGYADAWLLLPPLPEGWSVRFTETGVPDDTPLGPGWIYLRSAGNPSAAALRLWERP